MEICGLVGRPCYRYWGFGLWGNAAIINRRSEIDLVAEDGGVS